MKGQGESQRKSLNMRADGALQPKLLTYEKVMTKFATEFGKQKWVPEVMMGSGAQGRNNQNAAQALIEMLSVKTAKDLSLDMSLPKRKFK